MDTIKKKFSLLYRERKSGEPIIETLQEWMKQDRGLTK